MKRNEYPSLVIPIMMLLLSGCGRYIDWGKEQFYQGHTVESDKEHVQPYIKSIRLYDQLSTTAMFDALWLSDEVRTVYARLHIARQGRSEERYQAVLRRQIQENNHFITFFMLSLYDIPLGDPESAWSLYLEIGDKFYHPIEVKTIDLPYEYKIFFDKKLTRFKVAYRVRFDANDVAGNPLLTQGVESLKLHLRSASHHDALVWHVDSSEHRNPKPKQEKKHNEVQQQGAVS